MVSRQGQRRAKQSTGIFQPRSFRFANPNDSVPNDYISCLLRPLDDSSVSLTSCTCRRSISCSFVNKAHFTSSNGRRRVPPTTTGVRPAPALGHFPGRHATSSRGDKAAEAMPPRPRPTPSNRPPADFGLHCYHAVTLEKKDEFSKFLQGCRNCQLEVWWKN